MNKISIKKRKSKFNSNCKFIQIKIDEIHNEEMSMFALNFITIYLFRSIA